MNPTQIIQTWNGQIHVCLTIGTLAIIIAAAMLIAFVAGLMVCPPKDNDEN